MRLARVRPKAVNPVPSRHVLSPQRRKDAEISAEKNQERAASLVSSAQSGLMVGRTPWSAADAPVGLLGAKQTGFPGEKRVQGDPRGPGGPPHHFCGILSRFSALISASLRLCGEDVFSECR